MPAITLNRQSLSQLKSAAHAQLPNIKSSHLAEALAYAFGFGTHAALLAALASPAGRAQSRTPDTNLFAVRLGRFGYAVDQEFSLANLPPLADAAGALPAVESPPSQEDFSEPWLFTKTDEERCSDWGVRIDEEAPGRVWARHNVGGPVGPFATRELAARAACQKWDL